MEPHCRTAEMKIGNYTLVQTLDGDLLMLEVVSLVDRRPYSATYRNGTLIEELGVLFGSVATMYEAVELCCQTRNIEITDIAQLIVRLPNNFKQRQVVLQLTEADPTKLTEKATGLVINGLLQDQCSLVSKLEELTLKLNKLEENKYQSLSTQIDTTTPFYSDFTVKDGIILHLNEDVWSSVYLKQGLPQKGKFQVSLELTTFRSKCLMLGIGVNNLRKMQNSHSYQGSIMMCLSEGQTSIYERCGRSKATRGIAFEEGDRIIMRIDLDNLTLSWWLGDIQIIWTRILKEHLAKQLYVKCEMLGTGDQVRFY